VALVLVHDAQGFVIPIGLPTSTAKMTAKVVVVDGRNNRNNCRRDFALPTGLYSSNRGDDDDALDSLSNNNINKQQQQQQQQQPPNVRVNLLPEVDAVTITAIGFGLIAFNFFVLGNSGDGGIAGIVATIGNMLRE
jgi:hypothetical protein